MAVTIAKYNSIATDIMTGAVDLDTDTLKVMLVTSSYTYSASHAKRSSITNEVTNTAGTAYTAGGATLGSKTVSAAGVFDAADVNWASSSLTARGAVIYKSRGGASSADELIAFIDFGENKTSDNGNFTITWNASGIMSIA
jgi:hypothetical protein